MKKNPIHGKKPTADDLAGVPLCKEEAGKVRTDNAHGAHVAAPSAAHPPSADDLAGVPISVEGNEDLRVRPRNGRHLAP